MCIDSEFVFSKVITDNLNKNIVTKPGLSEALGKGDLGHNYVTGAPSIIIIILDIFV